MARARDAGVRDARVLEAIASVDRAQFVPEGLTAEIAIDAPLPIGFGQTTSQPSLIALMLEALDLEPDDSVLEVGTGLGYEAALLSFLVRSVCTVERVPELAAEARRRLAMAGRANVVVLQGDGALGAPGYGPFDAAVVAACASSVPAGIVAQLSDGARIVIPVRDAGRLGVGEEYVLCLRKQGGEVELVERMCPVRFVPLVTGGPPAT